MRKISFLSLLSLFIVSSCASIISTARQNVSISSSPSKAKVHINTVHVGQTPITHSLKRNQEHQVRITLDGYKPYEIILTKKLNSWFFGNILLGGLIGIIVDASTGAMYKLTPEQISATLSQGTAYRSERGDDLNIMVTLNADPEWEHIGQLESINQ